MSRDKRFNQGVASLLTREDFAEIASEQRKQMNERNRAGASGRIKTYALIKKIAHQVFNCLYKKNGKPPSFKAFLKEFEKARPSDNNLGAFEKKWWKGFVMHGKSESTVNRYWRQFRKDLDINN